MGPKRGRKTSDWRRRSDGRSPKTEGKEPRTAMLPKGEFTASAVPNTYQLPDPLLGHSDK